MLYFGLDRKSLRQGAVVSTALLMLAQIRPNSLNLAMGREGT